MTYALVLPSLSASHASANLPAPVVYCEGQPCGELAVRELTRSGALDERVAIVDAHDDVTARGMEGRVLAIVQPFVMRDGEVEHEVLCVGRASLTTGVSGSGASLTVVDNWTARLDEPVTARADVASRFDVGRAANRSPSRRSVGGREVFVTQHHGAVWSLEESLRTLLAMQSMDVTFAALPRALRAAPLARPVAVAGMLRQVLTRMLEGYAVRFERSYALLDGGVVAKPMRCVGDADGERIRLGWPSDGAGGGDVSRVTPLANGQACARRELALSRPREVEASVVLAPVWDASLAEGDAADYGRATSDDFPTYRNVYRLWALNVDGRFVGAEGPLPSAEFDWATLFDASIEPGGVELRSCLVLDDAGRPREALVEFSDDGGMSWAVYPGRVQLRLREGAVYLDDDTLPGAYYAAASAGGVAVRLTATLVHSSAQQWERWRGDVLRHSADTTAREVACFEWRDVAAGSRHADGVQAGELRAATADDRAAAGAWLLDRVDESAAVGQRWRVVLSRGWPLLKPGDVLLDAGGANLALGGGSQEVQRHGAVVEAVQVIWRGASPATVVRCVT